MFSFFRAPLTFCLPLGVAIYGETVTDPTALWSSRPPKSKLNIKTLFIFNRVLSVTLCFEGFEVYPFSFCV